MKIARSFAAAALTVALVGCVSQPTMPQIPAPIAQPRAPQDIQTPHVLSAGEIAVVKQGVVSSLKDPTSALFGNMVAVENSKGVVTVCGMVNGKNSYGGYVGDKPYLGVIVGRDSGKLGFVVIGMGGTDVETQATYGTCQKSGLSP